MFAILKVQPSFYVNHKKRKLFFIKNKNLSNFILLTFLLIILTCFNSIAQVNNTIRSLQSGTGGGKVLATLGNISGLTVVANNGLTMIYSVSPTVLLNGASQESVVWSVSSGSISSNQFQGNVTFALGYVGSATISCYRKDNNGNVSSTSSLTVQVKPPLTAPIIQSNNQTINYGSAPTILVTQLALGSDANYTYQWQTTTNTQNNSWTAIGSSLLNAIPPLTGQFISPTNYFRLFVKSGGVGLGSNIVTVSINVPANPPPCLAYNNVPSNFIVNYGITPLLLSNPCGIVPPNIYTNVTTFVGNGTQGYAEGKGTSAMLSGGYNFTIDATGNFFVSETNSWKIRKITPDGNTSTIVNNIVPYAITVDLQGNLYAFENNAVAPAVIFKISSGISNLFSGSTAGYGYLDGTAKVAKFEYVGHEQMITDVLGNIYKAEFYNNVIRKIKPDGTVSTLTYTDNSNVNNPIVSSYFNQPQGLAIDSKGNFFIAESSPAIGNFRIREITTDGTIKTFGPVTTGVQCKALAIDANGNLYGTLKYNNGSSIIKYLPNGSYSVIAGFDFSNQSTSYLDGIGTNARFSFINDMKIDNGGNNLFVADVFNGSIRKIALTGYSISPALPPGLTFNYNDGSIAGTPTQITQSTKYTIIGYNIYGSSSTTITFGVIADNSGALSASLVTNQAPIITAPYPMPFTSTLNVNVGDTEIADLTVKIFDAGSGNQVYFKQFTNQVGVLSLDVSNLNKGVYSLHLVYNNQHKIYKVFK